MKTLISFVLALTTLSAHAQVYKWADADGHIHYSDQPQAGVNAKELKVPQAPAQAATEATKDDWQERDRVSRENWSRQTAAQEVASARQRAAAPVASRSNNTMNNEEAYRRENQQILAVRRSQHITIIINNNAHGARTATKAHATKK